MAYLSPRPGCSHVSGPVIVLAGPVRLTFAGLRFDDSVVGLGNALVGGVDMPMVATTRLQATATRFLGDGSFRAWRVKTGPRFALPRGQAVGVYYAHYEDRDGMHSDDALSELTMPIGERLAARGSASWANVAGGLAATQGAVGLSWSPMRSVALSADVGVAHDGSMTFGTVPSPRRGLGLSNLDGGLLPGGNSQSSSQNSSTFDPVAQAGLRIMLP